MRTTDEITNLVHTIFGLALHAPAPLADESGAGRLFTFAESCTGGLLASSVTAVSGASAVFPGSVVTYSNRSKIEQLCVTPETLERYGAVSGQCAAEMAFGAMRLFDTALAVSVTGIAGPDGGSAEKPVGTVWFALARKHGKMVIRKGRYGNRSRRAVQLCAVRAALRLLVRGLYDINFNFIKTTGRSATSG